MPACTIAILSLMFLFYQGKYVEIQFSRGGEPIGGKISNFLLEKVSEGCRILADPFKPAHGMKVVYTYMVFYLATWYSNRTGTFRDLNISEF